MWNVLPLFLILLLGQYGNTCDNFLVQQCTDNPIGFKSISNMKCIQLVPTQFDTLIEYSVENYIIKKSTTCYDIISYNSSSTILFSNECREVCQDQYCLLFNNQPNTSIINIFYTESSIYDLINPITNNMLSYDYFLFDICSSKTHSQVLFIVALVLAGIVGILTIGVVLKFVIAAILKYTHGKDYNPYDWRWLRDLLCCRLRRGNRHENVLYIIENNPQSPANQNPVHLRNNFDTSSPRDMIPTTSSNNTHERQNNRRGSTSGNSSNTQPANFSSENDISTIHRRNTGQYCYDEADCQSNYSSDETGNHLEVPNLSTLRKLSSKISSAVSTKTNTSAYDPLQAKPTPDFSIIRF